MNPNPSEKKQNIILLIEDNPDHSELLSRSLERHPMVDRIVHLSNGDEAINYLFTRRQLAAASSPPLPDLILVDLRLPKVDGLEVIRRIKTDDALQTIPVVVLTSSSAQRDIDIALEYHANSYIVKPVTFHEITRMVEDLCNYWLNWNRFHGI